MRILTMNNKKLIEELNEIKYNIKQDLKLNPQADSFNLHLHDKLALVNNIIDKLEKLL